MSSSSSMRAFGDGLAEGVVHFGEVAKENAF